MLHDSKFVYCLVTRNNKTEAYTMLSLGLDVMNWTNEMNCAHVMNWTLVMTLTYVMTLTDTNKHTDQWTQKVGLTQ